LQKSVTENGQAYYPYNVMGYKKQGQLTKLVALGISLVVVIT
jgi:hypothetical protein